MVKDHDSNGIGHNSDALQDKSPTVEALERRVANKKIRFINI